MLKRSLIAACLLLTMQLFQGFTVQQNQLFSTMYGHEYYSYGGDTYLVNIVAEPNGMGTSLDIISLTVTRMSDCQDMGYCNVTGTVEKRGAYINAAIDIDMCSNIVFSFNESFSQGNAAC
ncbi:MAG TPA: hypothetical protein VD996_04810 [Chitinophagaceae bacterium]|nr:hypothetical protein [Chitinophagaceae bacterium]